MNFEPVLASEREARYISRVSKHEQECRRKSSKPSLFVVCCLWFDVDNAEESQASQESQARQASQARQVSPASPASRARQASQVSQANQASQAN